MLRPFCLLLPSLRVILHLLCFQCGLLHTAQACPCDARAQKAEPEESHATKQQRDSVKAARLMRQCRSDVEMSKVCDAQQRSRIHIEDRPR